MEGLALVQRRLRSASACPRALRGTARSRTASLGWSVSRSGSIVREATGSADRIGTSEVPHALQTISAAPRIQARARIVGEDTIHHRSTHRPAPGPRPRRESSATVRGGAGGGGCAAAVRSLDRARARALPGPEPGPGQVNPARPRNALQGWRRDRRPREPKDHTIVVDLRDLGVDGPGPQVWREEIQAAPGAFLERFGAALR